MLITHVNRSAMENPVTIPGPEGLLEGRLKLSNTQEGPIVIIFHPHPLHGGTMNNKIVKLLTSVFHQFKGCTTLRLNFRGVGNSHGKSVGGTQELDDAVAAMDWLIKKCEMRRMNTSNIWVAGFSFGGWIALQTAIRRPEVSGFISISPPVETYLINMLTPCPNGLIIQGNYDHVVNEEFVRNFASSLISQRGCTVEYDTIHGGDHYFTGKLELLSEKISEFLKRYV